MEVMSIYIQVDKPNGEALKAIRRHHTLALLGTIPATMCSMSGIMVTSSDMSPRSYKDCIWQCLIVMVVILAHHSMY